MSDSYDDYECKIQLAEHAWEVKTEHDRAVELAKAYERGWNAAVAQQEPVAWMHNFIEGNVITHIPADIGRHPERWTPLYTAPPKTEQEPVLWLKTWSDGSVSVLKTKSHAFADHELEPLYTAPPKREWVGLTAYEIQEIHSGNQHWGNFACAIEAKLREKNHG